jgi:hypothetical protein
MSSTGHFPAPNTGVSPEGPLRCVCGNLWPCVYEPEIVACPSVLMIGGAAFPCDRPTDANGKHKGWAHANKAAQAIWGKSKVQVEETLYEDGSREKAEQIFFKCGFAVGITEGVRQERARFIHFDSAKQLVESQGWKLVGKDYEPSIDDLAEMAKKRGYRMVLDDATNPSSWSYVRVAYDEYVRSLHGDGVTGMAWNSLSTPARKAWRRAIGKVVATIAADAKEVRPVSAQGDNGTCTSFGCGYDFGHAGDHEPGELWQQIARQQAKQGLRAKIIGQAFDPHDVASPGLGTVCIGDKAYTVGGYISHPDGHVDMSLYEPEVGS